MKPRSKKITTNRVRDSGGSNDTELHQVFLDELADMYDAEEQITKELPKMMQAAQSEELREVFGAHLRETEQHLERLEEVFSTLGEKVKSIPCHGVKGILKEGENKMKEKKGTPAINAVLIFGAQKIEHYEIASYGTLIAWAEQMGRDDVVKLLKDTLDEEKAADKKLTCIACETANQQAQRWMTL